LSDEGVLLAMFVDIANTPIAYKVSTYPLVIG